MGWNFRWSRARNEHRLQQNCLPFLSSMLSSFAGRQGRRRSIDYSKQSLTTVFPAPLCHSGEGVSTPGAPESRRSNQKNITSKLGSIQTQSASTPSQGITREAWIPGPCVLAHASRNDKESSLSGENARNDILWAGQRQKEIDRIPGSNDHDRSKRMMWKKLPPENGYRSGDRPCGAAE